MKLRERLSDLEHKQLKQDYNNLTEKEKESDRIYADKVIKLVSNKLRYVLSRHSIMRGSTKKTPKEIIKEVFE